MVHSKQTKSARFVRYVTKIKFAYKRRTPDVSCMRADLQQSCKQLFP